MSAHRYVEENGLAAMLATKRSAGVTPEVNLRECVAHTPLPSVNKAARSGFETQRRHHQKPTTGVISGPTKRTYLLHQKKLHCFLVLQNNELREV